MASVNDVYATAELAAPAKLDYIDFLVGSGTALELPLRIHLENPFLGSNCYIGSASTPVRLKLTLGTTAPPPPNTPISGSLGTITQNNDADGQHGQRREAGRQRVLGARRIELWLPAA